MKVAIFVEGSTELEFFKALVRALCGRRGIHLEIHSQFGGRLTFQSVEVDIGATIFILLANCNNDEQVKTQIRDNYSSLEAAGYDYIIGLRDIYPSDHCQLPRFQAALSVGLPTGTVPIHMHLSVLETEAWFLDEMTHFERIDAGLTISAIVAAGYDLPNRPGETWQHPAQTLHNIYQLVGKAYKKKTGHIQRTVNALSQEELYVNVRARAPHFNSLITTLESALF